MSDHEDTQPHGKDTGQGYPEQAQAGMGVDADEHAEDDIAPENGGPETSPERDGDPSQATGNPKAAGG